VAGRVCCGLIPHLELARRPELTGRPAVVGRDDGRVLAASPEAMAAGVRPGLTLRQAEALSPTAAIVGTDPVATSRLAERIAAELYDLAPVVEVRLDGRAWLDLTGVPGAGRAIGEARRRMRAAAGVEPQLGLAAGPFTAALAAARARPGRLLRVEDVRAFLGPLPVEVLPLDPEKLERLDLLGLRTLGAVAALGPRQLESQLGGAGRTAVLLARGEEPVPVEPWRPLTVTGARCQLEPPLEDREALLFVARGLCGDLAAELDLRGAGARKVAVRLGVEGGGPELRESVVRHPLSSAAELFGLVSSWLRGWRPAAPVTEVTVEVPELEAVGRRQLRLWMGGDGSAEEVDAALERLQERHGPEMVLAVRPALPTSPLPAQRYDLVERGGAAPPRPLGAWVPAPTCPLPLNLTTEDVSRIGITDSTARQSRRYPGTPSLSFSPNTAVSKGFARACESVLPGSPMSRVSPEGTNRRFPQHQDRGGGLEGEACLPLHSV
jgi:nucleotidyltransferase/DNA polymerase involved in DNA repair